MKTLTIQDPLYGVFEIISPAILELISSHPFQRLKGISQFGIPNQYYHLTGYDRFEHSIGVYILLQKLGASEAEQIAGLLHDVSHTAFSHLVDWVIGDSEKEDYQDKRHLSILQSEPLASILKKYDYTPEMVGNYNGFTLLEMDIPDICADRVDYVLRESAVDLTRQSLATLMNYQGQMAFTDEAVALQFAKNFLERQLHHWAGYEAVTRYRILSQMLKRAMELGVITLDDFNKDDTFVMKKIQDSATMELIDVLRILEQKDLQFLPKSKQPVKKKFRYVDPLVVGSKQKAQSLSQLNPEFNKLIQQAKEQDHNGIFPGVYN